MCAHQLSSDRIAPRRHSAFAHKRGAATSALKLPLHRKCNGPSAVERPGTCETLRLQLRSQGLQFCTETCRAMQLRPGALPPISAVHGRDAYACLQGGHCVSIRSKLEVCNGQMCMLACTHVAHSKTVSSQHLQCVIPHNLPHEFQHIGKPVRYVNCAVHRLGLSSRCLRWRLPKAHSGSAICIGGCGFLSLPALGRLLLTVGLQSPSRLRQQHL
jgi:hypothetical protein